MLVYLPYSPALKAAAPSASHVPSLLAPLTALYITTGGLRAQSSSSGRNSGAHSAPVWAYTASDLMAEPRPNSLRRSVD
ncbi:hypothetical protein NDU88_006624 [Pleurodeles waltl]|uniref:Uncharacterized protein n=1 Tax=Pleurodeles waltl TaxID=8319 RepID=A0AAV7X378_PLEWA|nr:hypothetical protein NDU88_006624 [Pleurodeles waltl]